MARLVGHGLAHLSHRIARGAVAALVGASLLVPAARAADGDWDTEKAKYEGWREDLREMVASRDTGWFEVDFEPLAMERILLKDGAEVERVFHYMTYRLRNRVSDNAQFLVEHASNFNEVMDSIVKQHERAMFDTENGPRLRVDGSDSIEDPEMATIIDRPDLLVRDRVVNLTVIAFDEDGTRFRMFDPSFDGSRARDEGEWVFDHELQQGAQEEFDFPNHGNTRYGMSYQRVREAIEEKEGRRLLSVHEVRGRKLLPYDSEVRNDEGVSQGEMYGVLIFDRLPTTGDVFTLQVQGLSNKLRFRGLQVQHAAPEQADKVQDYFNARILRRTYQVTVNRPGDEYFLDQAPLTFGRTGWQWVGAFNRIERRSTMAYSKYFLDNVPLGEERTDGQGLPVLREADVEDAFWQYHEQAIDAVASRYQADLEDVRAQQTATSKHYEQWLSEDDLDPDFIQQTYDRRMKQLAERESDLEAKLQALPGSLPDFKQALEGN